MKTIKAVKYIEGYKLKLLFDDNVTKIVDLTDMVKNGGDYFKPLENIELFKQVSLDDEEYPSSISWPNDADICPDTLYEMGVVESSSPRFKTRRHKRSPISTFAITKKRSKQK